MCRCLRRKRAKLKRLIINGERAGRRQTEALIAAFNSKTVLTGKGGYIFKVTSEDKNLYLGILPAVIEGERSYHFDIELPDRFSEFLTGSLSPEGIFSLIFIPGKRHPDEKELASYRMIYRDFADVLTEGGLKIPGDISETTIMFLRDSGLFPSAAPPFTIRDIADYDRSTPKNS